MYNQSKLYSVDISTGNVTEEVDWTTDIGTEYGPVIRVFPRFGQLWAVTKEDRVFWSRTAHYSVDAEDVNTEIPLRQDWGEWQELGHH